ncbi:hypothetical protein KC19_1G087200 [Ceratodon purpureus]|uniref:Secreted protein n=1 Tax=Ceratodon purpureus TaxID=3225 RepID=A0A8T0J671_CERPU|nr:hypothetical protein KC19_1G087200 [Ceratodon purpureus]
MQCSSCLSVLAVSAYVIHLWKVMRARHGCFKNVLSLHTCSLAPAPLGICPTFFSNRFGLHWRLGFRTVAAILEPDMVCSLSTEKNSRVQPLIRDSVSRLQGINTEFF